MKCVKCGKEVGDDYLYCPYCGKEINIVPEFEPVIEQEIDKNLSGIVDAFGNTTGSLPIQFEVREGFSFRKFVTLISGIVTIIILLLILLFRTRHAAPLTTLPAAPEETTETQNQTQEAEEAVIAKPYFEPTGGTFASGAVLTINKIAEGEIYYTVNGEVPTTAATPYTAPIELNRAGRYVVRAIYVNPEGKASEAEEQIYVVERPAPPVVMEESGEYTQNTMIVAMADPELSIFYTDDGSEPTGTSKRYVSPIAMPQGRSRFKFITVDADGNASDVTEREYHLALAAVLSPEEAVQRLMIALVSNELINDVEGHIEGLPGRNIYLYEGVVEIRGGGQYYKVNEFYMAPDGSTTPTGAIFAVNTHDGKVSRFGYDTRGNETLFGLK